MVLMSLNVANILINAHSAKTKNKMRYPAIKSTINYYYYLAPQIAINPLTSNTSCLPQLKIISIVHNTNRSKAINFDSKYRWMGLIYHLIFYHHIPNLFPLMCVICMNFAIHFQCWYPLWHIKNDGKLL